MGVELTMRRSRPLISSADHPPSSAAADEVIHERCLRRHVLVEDSLYDGRHVGP